MLYKSIKISIVNGDITEEDTDIVVNDSKGYLN